METSQYFQQAAYAAAAHEQMLAKLVAEGWQYNAKTGVLTHPNYPDALICEG